MLKVITRDPNEEPKIKDQKPKSILSLSQQS